ncbi:methyltransferase domain-containing protein [Pseudomonas sp. C27(2019)]|uniref:class I SAM-dependent methyltransferase n=1 Tax=Pseudomonas sp. C27(2019) TaxID=2604941 RepID=UPI0012441750|nr:methyltransferase domain-containing protein [Pseudomonas sp. C27(2019)]QEY58997.1 methyltransferase domain-containing protein [Pseudomonas sp. C27(2019)]
MTVQFYETNAEQFAQDTLEVDMSALHERFLAMIPPASRVLDAGCGAGRDTAAFLQLGYEVEAFDASAKLVEIAKEVSGIAVQHSTFLNFTSKQPFAGIWACASLLHVPAVSMSATLQHLAGLLQAEGVLYVSFKYGEEDTERDGRLFTNCTEQRLQDFLEGTGLSIKETWLSNDQRPDRTDEQWLNALLIAN